MKTLRNSTDLESVLSRVERVWPDARARWGRMTPNEMICHLSDSFLVGMGEKKASPATGPLQRTVVKWFALYVPLAWPKGVPARPEVEQGRGGTPPSEFQRDRSDLVSVIRRFAEPARTFDGIEHPMFGTLTGDQWLRWGYLHVDHHLRQFGA